MHRHRYHHWLRLGPFAGLWLAVATTTAFAAAPQLRHLFPAGGQRGQTITVTATGEFPAWPVRVWIDRPGMVAEALEEKGKFQLAIAGDAEPGVYWLRCHDGEGGSALRPFLVGQLPETEEVEPNDAVERPQPIDGPRVVNGRLQVSGDVDGFLVTMAAGETLIAALEAHSLLGSPLDGVLQVCQLRERRVSAAAGYPPEIEAVVCRQNHDARGLDPQLVFAAPHAGTYLVRLFAFPAEPNSSIALAGGEDYVYRLTLTTGGWVDHALPLAIQRDQPTELQLGGWNLPEPATVAWAATVAEGQTHALPTGELFRTAWQAGVAGRFPLAVVDHPSLLAVEPNPAAAPRDLTLPVTVSGRLAEDGQVDRYTFSAAQGEPVTLRLVSRRLGFPLDGVLTLCDANGKVLQELDDAGSEVDPELAFDPPTDGRFEVRVRDLHGRGGPRQVYRLDLTRRVPDFALTVAAEALVLAAGQPLQIPLTIDRRHGFAEAIEIEVSGLPAGVAAEPATSAADGESAKTVMLRLNMSTEMPIAWSGPIWITGRAAGRPNHVQHARFALPAPLAGYHAALWLTTK